jgi:toxin FitB
MIVDSNILIYSARPENGELRAWLQQKTPGYSDITRLEVLGFKGIVADDELKLKSMLAALVQFPVSYDIIDAAILLRQQHRLSLGDSIIAATAMALDVPLATANEKDFKNIPGLSVFNPMQP